MLNYNNIPLGLKITTQIPLDVKQYCQSELILKDLGPNNNLAFTYVKGLIVYCIENNTRWEWNEVPLGFENTGLLDTDFIYPLQLNTVFGINYSGKKYNFFNKVVNISLQDLQSVINEGSFASLTDNLNIEGDANGDFGFSMGDSLYPINYISLTSGSTDYTNMSRLVANSNRFENKYYSNGNYRAGLHLDSTGASLRGGFNLGNGDTELKLGGDSLNSTYFKDNRIGINRTALEYYADYSSTYTLRSLVDKGYVDSKSYSAGLGLELVGQEFKVVNLQKTITYPTDFTGTNYTVANTDNNYTIIVDNATTACTITVPSGLTSKIGVGFIQKGTADVTFVASGTTIYNPIGLKSKGQYYQTFIEQEGNTNIIYLLGNTKV